MPRYGSLPQREWVRLITSQYAPSCDTTTATTKLGFRGRTGTADGYYMLYMCVWALEAAGNSTEGAEFWKRNSIWCLRLYC